MNSINRRHFLSTALAAPLMTRLSDPFASPADAAQGGGAAGPAPAAPSLYVWQQYTLRGLSAFTLAMPGRTRPV